MPDVFRRVDKFLVLVCGYKLLAGTKEQVRSVGR
jgi:hypothetical protein